MARCACSFFPPGETQHSEGPDFWIKAPSGHVGVEVTELVRSDGESSFSPVEDESFHKKVVSLAETEYYRAPGAGPVCVGVQFLDDEQCKRENPEGWRRLTNAKTGRKLEKMSRSLVEFVKAHCVPGRGSVTFSKREMAGQMDSDTLPTGFEVISVTWPPGAWHSGESATLPPLDRDQLDAIIRKKDSLLLGYRAKAPDLPMWLLIYSGLSVSRGVPIPRGISEWKFVFDFDRVLLFSAMDNRVFEIGRLGPEHSSDRGMQ